MSNVENTVYMLIKELTQQLTPPPLVHSGIIPSGTGSSDVEIFPHRMPPLVHSGIIPSGTIGMHDTHAGGSIPT